MPQGWFHMEVEPLPAASQPPPRPPAPPAPPITGGPGDGFGEFDPHEPRRERHAPTRHGPLPFLQEVLRQMRMVVWPSTGDISRYAAVVGFTLVLVVAYLLVIDVAMSTFIDRVTGR